MKKRVRILAAWLLAAVMLAGCTGSSGAPGIPGIGNEIGPAGVAAESAALSESATEEGGANDESSAGESAVSETAESTAITESEAAEEASEGPSATPSESAAANSATSGEIAAEDGASGGDGTSQSGVSEADTASGLAVTASPYPQFLFQRTTESYQPDASDWTHRAYTTTDTVSLTPATAVRYPALNAALDELNKKRVAEAAELFAGISENLDQYMAEGYDLFGGSLYEENHLSVSRADDVAVGLRIADSSYGGGVHGYYWFGGYSFDAQTGEEIQLHDLVTSDEALRSALETELNAAYPDMYWFSDLDEMLARYLIDPPEQQPEETDYEDLRYGYDWVLDPQGVVFYFNPYALAAYAAGAQEVLLPFDKYPALFTGTYGATEGRFAKQISEYEQVAIDLNGDGTVDSLYLYGEKDEYSSITSLHIELNGNELVDRDVSYVYSVVPVIVRTEDGKTWLYVETTGDNDYRSLHIYDLSGTNPVIVGTVTGGISAGLPAGQTVFEGGYRFAQLTDPQAFYLGNRSQLLSTMSVARPCHVGSDGLPESEIDYDIVLTEIEWTLKQDTSFPGIVLRSDGTLSPSGQVVELAKGETLRPLRTDREKWVDCSCSDGTQVRVAVETGEYAWPQMVNGVELEEMLDGTMFAG